MARYLGLDLGDATIGVAISETGMFATALFTIRSKQHSYKEMLNELITYLTNNKIDVIVIGHPVNMNGSLGERSKRSLTLQGDLVKQFPNLKVVLWDERLSTKTCYNIIHDLSKGEAFRKQKKDELAAELILQNYLDSL